MMASCGDIPFIPECEVLYEGGPDSKMLFTKCQKNPGHQAFIPVRDFTKWHLPSEMWTDAHVKAVQALCELTVRVLARCTSPHRPDTHPGTNAPYPYSNLKGRKRKVRRCGTGFVDHHFFPIRQKQGSCPCPLCKESQQPAKQYCELYVITANHVICDDIEAADAIFELFYDSEFRQGVKCLYGVSVFGDPKFRFVRDVAFVQCVTHDMKTVARLENSKIFSSLPIPYGVMASHPHGCSKHITVGNYLHRDVSVSREVDIADDKRKPMFMHSDPYRPAAVLTGKPASLGPFVYDKSPQAAIPEGSKVIVSPFSNYFCRMRRNGKGIQFPSGTMAVHETTKPFVMVDSMMEFEPSCVKVHCSNDVVWTSHVAYDTPTCAGSSGAVIFPPFRPLFDCRIPHSGMLNKTTNRSGCEMEWCQNISWDDMTDIFKLWLS